MSTITQRVVRNLRRRRVTVLERHEWGSAYGSVYAARRRLKPAKSPADTVVQHITVTRPSSHKYGPLRRRAALKAFKADVRTVEKIGYDRFGSGVSYNWIVDMKHGFVAVGQPLDAKGTHTVNNKNVPGYSYDQNKVARAIAVLGMPETPLSAKAQTSIAHLLAAMIDERAVTKGFDYDPHSKFAWKDCPSDSTRSVMPKLRQRALRALNR